MEYLVTYPRLPEYKEISMSLDNLTDACETAIHISKDTLYNVYVTYSVNGVNHVIQYLNGVHQWSRIYA